METKTTEFAEILLRALKEVLDKNEYFSNYVYLPGDYVNQPAPSTIEEGVLTRNYTRGRVKEIPLCFFIKDEDEALRWSEIQEYYIKPTVAYFAKQVGKKQLVHRVHPSYPSGWGVLSEGSITIVSQYDLINQGTMFRVSALALTTCYDDEPDID